MELKFASVLEFRRVEISQKAPWPQPLLELHNGKGRRISFPYILMIFPLYVLNGRWILSCVEFGWFWADLSWKIRENLGPGSFGFDIFFRIRAACTRFWTHWISMKRYQKSSKLCSTAETFPICGQKSIKKSCFYSRHNCRDTGGQKCMKSENWTFEIGSNMRKVRPARG